MKRLPPLRCGASFDGFSNNAKLCLMDVLLLTTVVVSANTMRELVASSSHRTSHHPSLLATAPVKMIATSHLDMDEQLLSGECPPSPILLSKDEISTVNEEEEESVISSLEVDTVVVLKTSNVVNAVPRSIFSSYWNDNSRRKHISGSPSTIERPSKASFQQRIAPRAVLRSSIPPEQDPYHVFGIPRNNAIETNATREVASEDFSSLNTYERTLQTYEQQHRHPSRASATCESRPYFSGYHASEPYSLSSLVATPPYTVKAQSDTALIQKPQKSCLRRGRFSAVEQSTAETTVPCNTTRVYFQPKIQVRVFQRPVEQWSPNGWSSYFFGGWS